MKKMTVNYDEIDYKKVGSLRVKNKEERNVIDFFSGLREKQMKNYQKKVFKIHMFL